MIIESLQEFYQFFRFGQPIIAIDYGQKKMGTALSSPDHTIAMPFKMINSVSEKEKIKQILDIILDKKICTIVIGLPLNMDGTYSKQTKITLKFAENLAQKTNLPIFMQDERLTSKAADKLLTQFGFNRKKRNTKDDLVAASLILETVLMRI